MDDMDLASMRVVAVPRGATNWTAKPVAVAALPAVPGAMTVCARATKPVRKDLGPDGERRLDIGLETFLFGGGVEGLSRVFEALPPTGRG